MSKKVKIFGIVGLVLAIIIAVASYFGNSAPVVSNNGLSSSASTIVPGNGGTVTPSMSTNAFSGTLASINGINLDTSIFQNAGYKALRDYPVTLGSAVIGRQNPFAPLGSDSATPQTAAPLQVQTLAVGKVLTTSAEFGALVTAATTDPVTVVFQYGTSDAFGSATPPVKVTKNGTAVFTATGLTPGTPYYVEAVAVQGSSTATGSVMNFTTAGTQKH